MGSLDRLRGKYAEAISLYNDSLACNRARGSKEGVGWSLLHVGLARLYLGQWNQAEEERLTAERILRELGHERGRILVSIVMSRLLRRRGDAEKAYAHAADAHAVAVTSGYKRAIVLALEEFGDLQAERCDHDGACAQYQEALKHAEEIAPEGDLVYECCWRLARVFLEMGRAEEAEDLAVKAVCLSRASSDRRETGNGLATLALVRHRQGLTQEAAELIREALGTFHAIQTPFELAECHAIAATILGAESTETASALLAEATRIYRQLGAEAAHRRVEQRLSAFAGRGKIASATPSTKLGQDSPASASSEVRGERIVIVDTEMRKLASLCQRLGRLDSTVLFQGETGTGKEILARLVHESGSRKGEPFVIANCAAFPDSLLETELFGHKRGAFTGAFRDHEGMLEQAGVGTLLLDEIDKSAPAFQAKLLRVVEDKQIRPVGSTSYVPLRARLLCASNRDLWKAVKEGLFLEDLYFRLSLFLITIPPLRERRDDFAAMVELFLQRSLGRLGDREIAISSGAMAALRTYRWPGNVRELKNVVERAFFLAQDEGTIERWHLPPEVTGGDSASTDDTSLLGQIEKVERREIARAMHQAHGVKTEAARILGVSRKGLLDRLRRLGLE